MTTKTPSDENGKVSNAFIINLRIEIEDYVLNI